MKVLRSLLVSAAVAAALLPVICPAADPLPPVAKPGLARLLAVMEGDARQDGPLPSSQDVVEVDEFAAQRKAVGFGAREQENACGLTVSSVM